MASDIRIKFFLWLLLTLGLYAFYYYVQPSIAYAQCQLCDGNQYLLLSEAVQGKIPPKVQYPYYSRFMAPAAAALLPFRDLLFNFRIINLVFTMLGTGALYLLWKKLSIPEWLCAIGLLWLLLHWPGIIRLNALDPVTVDVPTYLVETLFIYIYLSGKWKYLWLLAPVAVFQRESLNAFIIALLVFEIFNRDRNKSFRTLIHLAGPLALSLLLKMAYTFYYPPLPAGDKTALQTVLLNFISFFIHPLQIAQWLLAVFFAYGAFMILALFKARVFRQADDHEYSFFLVTGTTALLLSAVGGGDYTRIAFLGFPFVMTLLLLLLRNVHYKKVLAAVVLSLPLMRIFSSIPDPGKDFSAYARWFPEFFAPLIAAGWAAYLVFCIIVLYTSNKIIK